MKTPYPAAPYHARVWLQPAWRRREFVAFGNTTPQNPSPESQLHTVPPKDLSKANLKPKTTWWDRFLVVAPLSNFLGGVSLMAGALLPGSATAEKPSSPKAATPSTVQTATTKPEAAITNDVKAFFTQLGWSLSTIGLFTGCVNGLTIGINNKQPSMVVSSLCNMITTPLIMVDPTMSARAAMWFFTGPWLMGYANKVRNENFLKEGETPRQFDMSALYQTQALKEKAAAGQGLPKAWLKEAGKALHFVAKDHWLLLSDSASQVKKWITQPKGVLSGIQQGFGETLALVRGQRKELPGFVQPSVGQNQVGSMLMYLGATPILLMGGQPGQVTEVCTKLLALGLLSANTSLFATGLKNKDGTLMVGIPLSVVGNATMHTTWGMALSQMATGAIQNYFRRDLYREKAVK